MLLRCLWWSESVNEARSFVIQDIDMTALHFRSHAQNSLLSSLLALTQSGTLRPAGAARRYRPLTPPAQPQAQTDPCTHQTALSTLGMPQQSQTNRAGTLSKSREPPESQQSNRALGAGAAHGWCMARTAPSIVSTSISSSDSSSPAQRHSQPQSASMCTAVHQASSSNSRDRVVFTTRTALSN